MSCLQMLGELQRGSAVTLDNGTVIQPHEVMETPATPGACLLLLDCPSLAYLPSLQQQQQLQALQQEAAQLAGAGDSTQADSSSSGTGSSSQADKPARTVVMIHLGPAAVTSSEPYAAWVSGFGPAVQHLMVSSDSQRSPTVLRAAVLQAQLNAIEPEVFSLHGFQALTQQQHDAAGSAADGAAAANVQEQQQQQQGSVTAAGSGCRFTLAPLKHQGLNLDSETAAPDWQQVQVRDWVYKMLSAFAVGCVAVLLG
jgi:hypothetical protein